MSWSLRGSTQVSGIICILELVAEILTLLLAIVGYVIDAKMMVAAVGFRSWLRLTLFISFFIF